MTDANTLTPCPFCGERAETYFIPERHSYQIECSDVFGCTARVTRDSEEAAIEAWNLRVPAPAPAPTDAELMQVIKDVAKNSAINRDGSTSLRIARAVLAKWGAPAPASQPAPAPMSPANRLVAYSAATRLRELGFEWDATAEAWLQPASKEKTMTDKPTPTDTPPPCDQELFDQGVSVGLFDIPKWTAEALCRGIAAATEARVDWHYIGGRVHIKALPAARAPADSVQEDAARLDYLHSTGSTVEMLPGEVDFYPMRFRVGGLHSAVSPNLREAIDIARKQGGAT